MTTKPMEIRMVDTLGQYAKIKEEVDRAVGEVMETGAYINGPATQSFRKNLSEYMSGHAIVCGNGTDALQIALMALDLKPGDEVITSPFTFFATAEVVAMLGLVPVFVDVRPDTFNINPELIEAKITSRTRVIIPVHLYGLPAEMEAIMALAKKHQLTVIEDAAQSIGSEYTFSDGTTMKSGMIGDIGCTSFYPSKNLGAYGDGGAVFTRDEKVAETLNCICNHGSRVRYYHERIGVNSRLDSMQAAVLDVKLRHLDEYNAARKLAADKYDAHFSQVGGILTPVRMENATHAFHQYTLRIEAGRAKRDGMKKILDESGIPSMIYYPVPLHLQEAYSPYGFRDGDFPVSEQLSGEVISLPMHTELDDLQINYIAEKAISAFHKA